MSEDVGAAFPGVTVPVSVVVGDRDQVEHEAALRQQISPLLPQATFTTLVGGGPPFTARGAAGVGGSLPQSAPAHMNAVAAHLISILYAHPPPDWKG